MTNAMKIFVKEYIELVKTNWGFWRRHWKAFAVITVVTVGTEVAIFEYNNIQYKVRKSNVEEDLEKIRKAVENVEPEKVLERTLKGMER